MHVNTTYTLTSQGMKWRNISATTAIRAPATRGTTRETGAAATQPPSQLLVSTIELLLGDLSSHGIRSLVVYGRGFV